MIDVQKMLIDVMKKNIFAESELMNKSAKQVLAELKTKYVDIKEEITSKLQHKLLTKMLNDRNKSAEIYSNANREDLKEKELTEASVIQKLLKEVEKDLPKQLSEDKIKTKIQEIINNNSNVNIGIIMKEFKELPADKALVSKLAKSMI